MARKVGIHGDVWSYLGVLCVSLLVYAGSLWCELVFDDISAIRDNADVLGRTGLAEMFANDFWGTPMHKEQSHKSYRPITSLTFRLNHNLSGLNPLHFHLVNILLHSLVCLLLLYLLRSTLKNRNVALTAAILFAVHPIHSEAVVGVVGRAELLAATFFVAALIIYRRCLISDFNEGGLVRHLLQMASFALSVILATLSKEQGITVLGLTLIFDLTLIKTCKWDKFRLSRLIFILLIGSSLLIMRFRLMQGSLPVFTTFDNPAAHANFPERHLTFSYLIALNIRLLIMPIDLCCDWTMGTIPLVKIIDPRNLITLATFALMLVMGVRAVVRRDTELVLAMAMMALPFLPASNLFFHVGFVVAERILYLPSMGFVIIVAKGLNALCHRFNSSWLQYIMIAVLVLGHSVKSVVRSWDWQNELTLFKSGLKVTQSNAKLFNNVGHALESNDEFDLALIYFEMAAQLQPDDAGAHINVGRLLTKLNKSDLSIENAFKKALNLMPDKNGSKTTRVAPQHLNVFIHLAALLTKNNRLMEADQLLKRATVMRPDFVRALINRGDVLVRLQRHQEAEEVFQKALLVEPNNADILHNLGVVNLAIKENLVALKYFDEALEKQSEHVQALISSASLIQEINRQDLRQVAYKRLHKALEVVGDGDNRLLERIFFNLAMILTDDNRLKEAEENFERALALMANSRSARFNLALLLHDQQRHTEALGHLEKLLHYHPDHIKGLVLMGDIYTNNLKDLVKAKECYDRIVLLDKDHVQARHNLCVLLVEQQRLQEALECLIEVEKLVGDGQDFDYVNKHRRILEKRIERLNNSDNGSTA